MNRGWDGRFWGFDSGHFHPATAADDEEHSCEKHKEKCTRHGGDDMSKWEILAVRNRARVTCLANSIPALRRQGRIRE